MQQKKRIVIVGATSSIATHCLRLWLNAEPLECILIGRDQQKTECVATDLQLRSQQSSFQVISINFLDANLIEKTVLNITDQGPIDSIFIAHGMLPSQQDCENNLTLCEQTLLINGISPVLFAESFAKHLEKIGRGRLILISSVAGDRGRKSNYVYGSAKSMVSTYAEGLQHRFAHSNVNVILVKPGPTETPMTRHLQDQMKLASVDDVAKELVHAVSRGQTLIYVPKIWRMIMRIVRIIPSAIFNRLI
jgi:decaprenylphospho-beta-D-erythro-pentofuranosid-2-ulose 2-reductase